jgi:hypothetical protein
MKLRLMEFGFYKGNCLQSYPPARVDVIGVGRAGSASVIKEDRQAGAAGSLPQL